MSKITFSKTWNFEPLDKIVVTNHMAPLMINSTEGDTVSLEGIIELDAPSGEHDAEDYLTSTYAEGILSISLDEIESIDNNNSRASMLKLGIPVSVTLEVETDNYPLSLVGLENSLRMVSENAPVTINNSNGDKHIESENGPVRLNNCNGNLYAKLENGPFSAEAIIGDNLHLESENGPLKVRLGSFVKVELISENGPIYYETQPVEDGDFSLETENGSIHMVLPFNFDFELKANTESGKIKSHIGIPFDIDGDIYSVTSGTGSTKIKISTENGTIKLSNDGHLNLDYVKGKMEQLKAALIAANTSDEKEKVVELMNKVIDYLNRAVKSISEEKVKDKVNEAIIKLKIIGEKFDFNDTKDKVIINIEEIGSQLQDSLKEGIKDLKHGFEDVKSRHFHGDFLQEYIRKVTESPLIKPYLGANAKNNDKEEIADRSRLKILDMLEAGKISTEEAERLLKAIGKE